MPTIYDSLFEHEISPAAEMFCLVLATMAVPVILFGFGIKQVAEFVMSMGRRDSWV